MSRIDELLDEEGTAAENYEMPEQLPDHVRTSRRHLTEPTVVSVRLSADEHDEFRRAAKEAGLPISTLIRLRALERLRIEDEGGSVDERLTRLEQEVFRDSA